MQKLTMTNPKETLRKLWTDHAVYTKFVITDLLENLENSKADTDRLLSNQDEIGTFMGTIMGTTQGVQFATLLKEHIGMVADCVYALISKNINSLSQHSTLLFNNADVIGTFLHQLYPDRYSLEYICSMFKEHNQYVLDIMISQYHHESKFVTMIYDAYYTHMLQLSDVLYELLSA